MTRHRAANPCWEHMEKSITRRLCKEQTLAVCVCPKKHRQYLVNWDGKIWMEKKKSTFSAAAYTNTIMHVKLITGAASGVI